MFDAFYCSGKAFDIVDRSLLISKLTALNLPSNILKWVASFLSNRFQLTTVQGSESNILPINMGVVQGSAVGPTLFSIMISDLKPISTENFLVKFADDLTLLVPELSDTELSDEYYAIKQWAQLNKMIINTSKTKEIVFHRPKPLATINPAPIDGIQRVAIAKLLGVTIDECLSFSIHITNIVSQCNQRSFLLRNLRRGGLNNVALDAVFNALVVSRILYCISVWGGFAKSVDTARINSVFTKSKKYGHTVKSFSFDALLLQADKRLFKQISSSEHCLNHLLPPTRGSILTSLRKRGHPFLLPNCTFDLFKHSYINRMLFSQI